MKPYDKLTGSGPYWKSNRTEKEQFEKDILLLEQEKKWKEDAFVHVGQLIDHDQWQQAQERHVAELLMQIMNGESCKTIV